MFDSLKYVMQTSSVDMILRRGKRTMGRSAVTGRGRHSVTQYTAITRITKAHLIIITIIVIIITIITIITNYYLASGVLMANRSGQRRTGAARLTSVRQWSSSLGTILAEMGILILSPPPPLSSH